MVGSFELMDLDSGNLVGSYVTLEEALEAVGNMFAAFGFAGIDDLGLVRANDDDSQEYVAAGPELAQLAMTRAVVLHTDHAATPSPSSREKRRAS